MRTLFHGGDIITMEDADDAPECLVIQDEEIVWVGDLPHGRALLEDHDEQIDLAGACLLPGFIDAHGHMEMFGRFAQMVDLSGCESFEDIVETLTAALEEHEGDGVLTGVRYDHNFLAEGRHPDRTVLDRVSTTVPVFILHQSVHLGVAGSALLARAGIDGSTPDPAGGRFGREQDGRTPDGYIEELPALAALGILPTAGDGAEASAAVTRENLLSAQRAYFARGITTCQEGAASLETVEALQEVGRAGELLIDVVAYPLADQADLETLVERSQQDEAYRDHVRIGGIKLILDGSPQGRSAWLSAPYERAASIEGDAGYRGYATLPDDTVRTVVGRGFEEGLQVLAHCNGDAAAEQFLVACEAAGPAARAGAPAPVMIHAQTVRDDQLERMVPLGMVPSFFVGHVHWWGDVHVANLGEDRGRRISPVRSALERGLAFTLHQDAPVTDPDMVHTLWTAVNRVTRAGRELGPEQAVSAWDALRGVTVLAAQQYGEQHRKGTLAAGRAADLVVLDRSPLSVEAARLRELSVLATYKDGRLVHQSG